MATKTVVKRLLGRWAPLSADYQMQKALQLDQSVSKGIDAEPEYPDNGEALEAETVQPEVLPTAKKKDPPIWLCTDCGRPSDVEIKKCPKCTSTAITKQA
jgi:recombinational DNA repair protein RecT